MTVLEKIRRCVSLVWDFQEFYGEEDIEDFCSNELHTYPQHNEIMEYFKHIETLEKENAELKAQLESERDLPAIAYMQGAEKQKKKDEEELKKWKDEWQEQVQKATDEGYARTLQTMQLSKAKELLKKLVLEVKGYEEINGYDTCEPVQEAEQFISEVEK